MYMDLNMETVLLYGRMALGMRDSSEITLLKALEATNGRMGAVLMANGKTI